MSGKSNKMVSENNVEAASSLGVVFSSSAWCIKVRNILKGILKRLGKKKKNTKKASSLVKISSKQKIVSWSGSLGSFAYRQQRSKSKGLWLGYRKLKQQSENSDYYQKRKLATAESLSFRNLDGGSGSFSFENVAVAKAEERLSLGAAEFELVLQGNEIVIPSNSCNQLIQKASGSASSRSQKRRNRKQAGNSKTVDSDTQLHHKWHEVVEMVVADSFDDLVDLEEFLGYYLLLRSPVYLGIVQNFFNEFCSEFCDDIQLVNLFIPELQDFPSFASSERLSECLPPSPC